MKAYARLVRLYPADRPRDEILDTVLESSGRFSYREAFSLILGALRARTGADVHRSPAEFARSAARIVALALLVYAAAVDVLTALPLDVPAVFRAPDGIVQYATAGLAALILHMTAIVALARGAYRLAAITAGLGLAAAVAGMSRYAPELHAWYHVGFWAAPIAMLLILALLPGSYRERSSPAGWLLAVFAAIVVLPTGAGTVLWFSWIGDQQNLLVVIALALAWALVDARVPLAVAAIVVCPMLADITGFLFRSHVGPGAVLNAVVLPGVVMVALIAAAAVSRRRAVL